MVFSLLPFVSACTTIPFIHFCFSMSSSSSVCASVAPFPILSFLFSWVWPFSFSLPCLLAFLFFWLLLVCPVCAEIEDRSQFLESMEKARERAKYDKVMKAQIAEVNSLCLILSFVSCFLPFANIRPSVLVLGPLFSAIRFLILFILHRVMTFSWRRVSIFMRFSLSLPLLFLCYSAFLCFGF